MTYHQQQEAHIAKIRKASGELLDSLRDIDPKYRKLATRAVADELIVRSPNGLSWSQRKALEWFLRTFR